MLCNWSYKWSWRARSNSIENEFVFPLKSSRVTSKIHFTGKCLANSNSGSFRVADLICLFWPLICKWNHHLLNLAPCLPSLVNPKRGRRCGQSAVGKLQSHLRCILGDLGSLALGRREGRSLQVRAMLPPVEEPVSASLANLCLVFFCGWEGVIFNLGRWKERQFERQGNKKQVRISYATFATKSSITWNYNVTQERGKESRTCRALVSLGTPQRICWTIHSEVS